MGWRRQERFLKGCVEGRSEMPRYEYECPECRYHTEYDLPLNRCDEKIDCHCCGRAVMRKLFTKLTTSWKDKDRKWGTSLYRSHDKGEKIGKEKRKGGKNE